MANFSLSDVEKLRSDRFKNEMTQKHGKSVKFSYEFTQTSIGIHANIICRYKKVFIEYTVTKNITDYGRW